jgi:hypothetical protein
MGYGERLKTAESVDPAAISNLMTMTFERRKSLEDRAMQLLGSVNTVVKSIIAITYELKELDRNLTFYDLLNSKEPEKAAAGELALKRIFIDNVDARKGRASLAQLSGAYAQGQGGAGFIDLLSVFYAIKSLKDAENINKNEQYKSIIRGRYAEYVEWKKINGADLKNRREMLLQYLKSQFASYNMYSEWAAQTLRILKRINVKGISSAREYMEKGAKKPDVFELANFAVEIMAAKQIYRHGYDVEYQKVFGKKGIELPSKVVPKTIGDLVTQGPREVGRSFLYKRMRRYGPKVIAAQEVSFAFTERQTFPPGVPQERPQYAGSLTIKMRPYCFLPDEWYLFKKITEAYINKTVFEGIDQVAVSSLKVIAGDLDKYIKEAEKREKKEDVKKESNFALMDIYQSFKDDIIGINKSLSSVGISLGRREGVDENIYEIELNHRLFGRMRTKDAIAVGLVVAGGDADIIYEELKRRKKLLHSVDTTHNPLF